MASRLQKADADPKIETEYGVREFSDWKEMSDLIEHILKERGEVFLPIRW